MNEKLLNDEVNFMITNASKKELFDYIIGLKIQNEKYKEIIDKSIKCIDYHNRYSNDEDICQFVDIKSEILEPLKDILEQNEENSNIYLKEVEIWKK